MQTCFSGILSIVLPLSLLPYILIFFRYNYSHRMCLYFGLHKDISTYFLSKDTLSLNWNWCLDGLFWIQGPPESEPTPPGHRRNAVCIYVSSVILNLIPFRNIIFFSIVSNISWKLLEKYYSFVSNLEFQQSIQNISSLLLVLLNSFIFSLMFAQGLNTVNKCVRYRTFLSSLQNWVFLTLLCNIKLE